MVFWIWLWAMAVFGLLLLRPSTLKRRLRERIQQALDRLSRALPVSPTEVSQTRQWLIQAGYRHAFHVNYYFGARVSWRLWGLRVSRCSQVSTIPCSWPVFPDWDSSFPA